jgi:protein-tyrosine phosphatase
MRILMVCLGNICRSPLADGILRRKVQENNLTVEVDSAGTANYHIGAPPDKRMILTAKNRGTDISMLRARQFKSSDFDNFDIIYVMDESNYENVMRLANNDTQRSKVKMITAEIPASRVMNIPDPFYGEQEDFDLVYDLLDTATDTIINKLIK